MQDLKDSLASRDEEYKKSNDKILAVMESNRQIMADLEAWRNKPEPPPKVPVQGAAIPVPVPAEEPTEAPSALPAVGEVPTLGLFDNLKQNAVQYGINALLMGVFGLGGWKLWVMQRASTRAIGLITKRFDKDDKKPEATADADGGFRGSSRPTFDRELGEATEYLRLSQLEGHSPIQDALIGRLALDELETYIEGDDSGQAGIAAVIKQRLLKKVSQMAPII